jgi:hypothetical protein
MGPGQSEVCYRINDRDEIVFLNDAWIRFAVDNHGYNLTPRQVLQHPLWNFLTDDVTRQVYADSVRRVRKGQDVRFDMRCDSPSFRRFLELSISLCPEGQVEFTTREIRREVRTPISLLITGIPRSYDLLHMCSWCKRVEMENNTWVEIEDAVARLQLYLQPSLPSLTHGICDECMSRIHDTLAVAA